MRQKRAKEIRRRCGEDATGYEHYRPSLRAGAGCEIGANC